MTRRKKWLLILVIVAIVIGATVVAAVMSRRDSRPSPVETAKVERRQVIQTVHSTGRIQPVTQVNISADVSAKITRLPVEEGDWVEKGTFLLELDRERYIAAVESAEANLRAAEASVNLAYENMQRAIKDHERIKNLFERNLESPSAMDQAFATAEVEKARHKATQDQAEQARAALKQAKDDLSKTRIYAPMSGTVSALYKEVGEIALGSQFQEDVIMVISNLAGMEAQVDVDENDIVAVGLGDRATIDVDALPDTVLEGAVTEIANTAKITGAGSTDQRTEFEVKIGIIDPDQQLRPGMTATADIVTEVKDDVIAVPIQCVAVRTPEQILGGEDPSTGGAGEATDPAGNPPEFVVDKDGFVTVVWVVENGRVWAKPVKTGIQSEEHIEIVEGLEEDEVIVVGSYRAISRDLRHGAMVEESRSRDRDAPAASG
ncbi:MAG: efflux RND transporter periplasmic adaptor subunit [Acidobacteriota bacterium]|nr:MAG: efflux RND transporter periplasmic adaptor subunit [Acidobacteriota bacterium]